MKVVFVSSMVVPMNGNVNLLPSLVLESSVNSILLLSFGLLAGLFIRILEVSIGLAGVTIVFSNRVLVTGTLTRF